MIKRFYPLKKGDTIGVIAPSARFDENRLNQGIDCLKTLGFQVHVPEAIFREKRYLAGDDASRAAVVNALFADPKIKGIIAARGGFGAMRMLKHLDWELIRENPKLVIGFSDATAFLMAVVQQAQFAVVHGPNLVSLANADPLTISSFYQTITGSLADILISQGQCLEPGQAAGKLLGGNLATLTHLIGTPFQPDFMGAVLFLEDVGEPAYKIDRMLSQMKMAGLFRGVKGVITGSFENCDNPEYIPWI
ncbi:MAG: LD-carboxypeptidase, partial [Proteobacteria bacterium]|nr:LD-carboxypeptidase [Pseudomonadota bacterium]